MGGACKKRGDWCKMKFEIHHITDRECYENFILKDTF